jgi:hypothetical protein
MTYCLDPHLPPSNTINRSQGTGLLLNLSCVTRAGSGEKVSLKRKCLLREFSEEKMSLKIYLWREYGSEENMSLKRNTFAEATTMWVAGNNVRAAD